MGEFHFLSTTKGTLPVLNLKYRIVDFTDEQVVLFLSGRYVVRKVDFDYRNQRYFYYNGKRFYF